MLSFVFVRTVRGGAKALQKLTARDRLRDYVEAKERLERAAAGAASVVFAGIGLVPLVPVTNGVALAAAHPATPV